MQYRGSFRGSVMPEGTCVQTQINMVPEGIYEQMIVYIFLSFSFLVFSTVKEVGMCPPNAQRLARNAMIIK